MSHNISKKVDMSDGNYQFSPKPIVAGETLGERRAKAEMERDVELQASCDCMEIARLKEGLRDMVSNTAVYGEHAGEFASQLLRLSREE